MSVQSVLLCITVLGTLTSWPAHRAAGQQQVAFSARTPRFFFAPSTAAKPVEIQVSDKSVLDQAVSLHGEDTTIGGLLAAIQRQTGLTFAYDHDFPATRLVTLEAESITVGSALAAILVGTGVDVVLTPTGHVWLRESSPPTARVQEGTILGRVTDKETGNPIIGATVVLDPTRQNTTTSSDGRYRFRNLRPGNYTVRARYIGYRSLVASVVVSAGQEETLDFPLEKSAQPLEQLVVTGTVLPTEVRAIPTPISVITESDIEQQHARRMDLLIRQAVPSAVAWNFEGSPQTALTVRGASSVGGGSGSLKVYLDGVEISNRTFAAIDPNSIERVEIVRGPQAGTIYGSDAIGGVMQVFTKRGDPNLASPQVEAQAALGVIQSPYEDFGAGSALRQEYGVSVRGGTPSVSYNFGGGYTRAGDWVPEGRFSIPSAYAGIRVVQGPLTVDLSGRYYAQNRFAVIDPNIAKTGFVFLSKPLRRSAKQQEQTLGAHLSFTAAPRWRHTLTVGTDRYLESDDQIGPRLTTPSDTLFFVLSQVEGKTSIAYNSSVQFKLARDLAATLVTGIDHYSYRSEGYSTSGAVTQSGAIQTVPAQPSVATRDLTSNTGYFVQAQLNVREALFLTGGIRAEDNSNFGSDFKVPLSSRAGLSYTQQAGATTVKLRGSYGEAIRPPTPGQRSGQASAFDVRLANPFLGPERQKGWDGGVDVILGQWGAIGATYYHQIARDLIQFVVVDLTSTPQTVQYQNVGRVKNTGFEFEGTTNVGMVQLRGQFAITKSRVQELAPNYTGELLVGDQVTLVPRHTGGFSVTLTPGQTSITGGLSYVGSWTNLDRFAQFSCFGGTGPCQASTRGYLKQYNGFVKFNLSISHQLTPALSGFLAVDDLTNNATTEFWNQVAVPGRVGMLGLRVRS